MTRSDRTLGLCICAIAFFVAAFISLCWIGSAWSAETIDTDVHRSVVDSLESQIMLMKVLGTGIVLGLASAVGFLFKHIVTQNRAIIKEVKASGETREEWIRTNTELHSVLKELLKKIEYCPGRLSNEMADHANTIDTEGNPA